MRRAFIVALFLSVALWGTAVFAQGIPQGSYQQTCNNVAVNGDTIVASCQDANGNWRSASLPGFQRCSSDIRNDNGILRCEMTGYSSPSPYQAGAGPAGSYLQSCQNVEAKGDDLHARCRTASGDMRDAKLDDYAKCRGDIANEDGHLRCLPGAPVGGQAVYGGAPYGRPGYGQYANVNGPNGSYLQSCTNVRVSGDDLHARCQTADGTWRDAKLDDYRKCGGDIVNEDGHLHCQSGTPVGTYGPGPYNAPATYAGVNGPNGTYTQSCMNIHVSGDDLKATCRTNGGDMRDAKLDDYRKCKSDIINDDGRLRCQK